MSLTDVPYVLFATASAVGALVATTPPQPVDDGWFLPSSHDFDVLVGVLGILPFWFLCGLFMLLTTSKVSAYVWAVAWTPLLLAMPYVQALGLLLIVFLVNPVGAVVLGSVVLLIATFFWFGRP